jgi:hypothetical protein
MKLSPVVLVLKFICTTFHFHQRYTKQPQWIPLYQILTSIGNTTATDPLAAPSTAALLIKFKPLAPIYLTWAA